MVVFVCGSCGTSLKKSQVDDHMKFKCRGCTSISCMDCLKDFWDESYNDHTKCKTENERYGGKDFVEKEFKNAKRQDEWVELVHSVAAKAKLTGELKQLFNQMKAYDNVPKKKPKFQNFIKSSFRIKSQKTLDEAWNILLSAKEERDQKQKENNKDDITTPKKKTNVTPEKEMEKPKKEKNKKKKFSELMAEEANSNGIAEATEEPPKKKKKKKSKDTEDTETDHTKTNGHAMHDTAPNESEEGKKSKKKKHKNIPEDQPSPEATGKKKRDFMDDSFVCTGTVRLNETLESAESKFKWKVIIKKVLKENPDHKLKIKRLRKRVFAHYYACHSENDQLLTESELHSTFNQKLKNPTLKVDSKFVTLKKKNS